MTKKRYYNSINKATGAALWLFAAGITFTACRSSSTSSNNQTIPMTPPPAAAPTQYADTTPPRLLSIANLHQTDSGKTVTVWFYETPQIFELSIADEKGTANYTLLKKAFDKQEPVNVTALYTSAKNTIAAVTVATPAQLEAFRAQPQRQSPTPVPAPKQ